MRFQVRVTEQYPELEQHLACFKPEYRGKRLLILAAMQLASMGTKDTLGTSVPEIKADSTQLDTVALPSVNDDHAPKQKRSAPKWITGAKNG